MLPENASVVFCTDFYVVTTFRVFYSALIVSVQCRLCSRGNIMYDESKYNGRFI